MHNNVAIRIFAWKNERAPIREKARVPEIASSSRHFILGISHCRNYSRFSAWRNNTRSVILYRFLKKREDRNKMVFLRTICVFNYRCVQVNYRASVTVLLIWKFIGLGIFESLSRLFSINQPLRQMHSFWYNELALIKFFIYRFSIEKSNGQPFGISTIRANASFNITVRCESWGSR